MMVDFALAAEREEGKSSRDAIFRLPAALPADSDDDHVGTLGALPADLSNGTGSELRRPLGIQLWAA